MKVIRLLLIASLSLLTACDPPGATGQNLAGGKALVSLTMAPLTTVAPLQQAAAGFRAQVFTLTDFNPSSYQLKLRQISLYTSNFTLQPLYQGATKLEMANKAAFEAVLNENALSVPEGTYEGLQLEPDAEATVTATASLGGQTLYTKTALTDDPTMGPAQPVTVPASDAKRNIRFAKPLVIKAGDNVKLSVLYDLTGSGNFYANGDGMTRYANGKGILMKSFPFFAFAGDMPKPDIYKITVQDPNLLLAPSNKWYFHTLLFAGTDGELQAVQSIGRLEDGFEGDFRQFSFTDRIDTSKRNADGTYHLEGHPNASGAPQYRIDAFQRATHDGTVVYNPPDGGAAVTLTYHAVREQ